jgi:hypothetical protein
MKAPKIKIGYLYIREFMEGELGKRVSWVNNNQHNLKPKELEEYIEDIEHLKLLLNDFEYLEYCAGVIEDLQGSKKAFKKILEVLE